MEKIWHLKLFKSKKLNIFLFLFCIFFPLSSYASGEIQKIRRVKIPTPVKVSIDRYGNIYFADDAGLIYKYGPKGDSLHFFSPQRTGTVTLLEAWRGINVFIFYEEFQEIMLFDRFLSNQRTHSFRPAPVRYAGLATPSADNNVWIFDEGSLTLEKYNFNQQTTDVNFPLNMHLNSGNYNINFMRAYHNKVFLNDKKNGILVFDNMGSYIRKLPYKGLNYFNFKGDELYFCDSNQVVFVNLYEEQKRHVTLPSAPRFVLTNEDYLYTFFKNKFVIYRYTEEKKNKK